MRARDIKRVRSLLVLLIGGSIAGCATVNGGPDRLYSVTEEVSQARSLLESSPDDHYRGLVERYYAVDARSATADTQRMYYRNEIIARRMYVIDVEYSQYEAALTSERQKFGFLTAAAANSLGIASAVTTPERSAQLLSAVASAIGATRGFYDSEIVIAKSLQIAEGQMRAQRDTVAKRILQRRNESSVTYPLSLALSDLEEYYRAGTLNSGLIKAAGDAGTAAHLAAISKDAIFIGTYAPNDTSNAIQKYITTADGKPNRAHIRQLNGYLLDMGLPMDVRTIADAAEASSIRQKLIDFARDKKKVDITK